MNIQMKYSKMRSESSEYVWKTTGAFMNSWRIKIALESSSEKNTHRKLGRKSGWILICILLLLEQSEIDGTALSEAS